MPKPTALITGITGFTGPYVAEQLKSQGYDVVGLSNSGSSNGNLKVDLKDKAALADAVASVDPDVVVHLAAIAFVAHADDAALYEANVVGTSNLLAAISELKSLPSRVLLASSANVYGNGDGSQSVLSESSAFLPANHYAISKMAMEYAAKLWLPKLPIVFSRPFNYTGVNQSQQFLVPKIVDHFSRGARSIELGNINVYRDFSDVRDVAKAYGALLEHSVVGEVYNVCSGVEHSLSQVIEMLSALAGYNIEVNVNPAFVRANEVVHLLGSRAKLDQIQTLPKPIALQDTLSWMMDG